VVQEGQGARRAVPRIPEADIGGYFKGLDFGLRVGTLHFFALYFGPAKQQHYRPYL
jgi:hypothetical protein